MSAVPIVLVPHDPAWAVAAAEMRAAIVAACAPWVTDVLHIGSTAIPGIRTKPIIDLMPLLKTEDDGTRCVAGMERLGFTYRGAYGIAGRFYFVNGDPRTHNAHMYAHDHPQVARHVRFRDTLIARPDLARRYERLKRDLAARFPNDINAYAEGKDAFCGEVDVIVRGG